MRRIYEIKDKKLIEDVLENSEFGTLALCIDNKPYSLPLNYVKVGSDIFFHGAKKGKKIDIIKQNENVSFSVVESYSVLPSYFSTDDGRASPATHVYKSVILDGKIEFIEEFEQKVVALEALMKKYQKEGGYKSLSNEIHKKIVTATAVYKLVPNRISAKFHFGQSWDEKRFKKVCEHLKQRGTKRDLKTIELLKEYSYKR